MTMTGAMPPLIHVVDDDESLRTALSRLLTASGYRVAPYGSAAEFMERTCADEPGCILLDVDMPGLNGLQLQESLGKAECGLPIIFLTGHGSITMSVRAIKAGAEDFLTKPVVQSELISALQRALQRYHDTHIKQTRLTELRRRLQLLTAREKQVLDLLVQGMLNKQIAYELGNTERTVKAHRHSIMEKLQAKSLAELLAIASQVGMLNSSVNSVPSS